MKIAIPVTRSNQIDDHFGHCEFYRIFNVSENNEVQELVTLKSEQGCGCKSNIASVLADNGVSIMLAGGIGAGAINVLNNSGIEVIRGCSGDAFEVVNQYVAGAIDDSGESCAAHEQHHQEGSGHICSH
ncbi:MAG: NifB/NifX family molybdenum-iron cluster-binding protein [Bacteroidetes bacterium]|nr:NifB/NifX family molybdenum-iron cluster-binding protein [Bacteroidota bacterium]